MIFFSIIIPTYNDLSNLKKCLKGLFRQNFDNFEIIVINDASTDGTSDYLDSLKKKNLSIYNLSENKGPAFSRNIGIKNSNGIWLSFLDSDDFWVKSRLDVVFKNIQFNNNYDVYCHNQTRKEIITKNIKKLYTGPYKKNFYKNLILQGNCLITSATVVKKKFIKNNDIYFRTDKKYYSVEDYDFWLNLANSNAKFFFIPDFLGFYCIHKNNITTNILKHKKNYLSLLFNHIFKIKKFEKNRLSLWKKIYCKYLLENIIIYAFTIKNLTKSRSLFFITLKKFHMYFILSLFNYFWLKLQRTFRKIC